MAQARPRFCPQCGTPTTAGQGFCANCGRVLIAAPSEVDTVPQGQPRQRFSQTGPQTAQQSPQPVWARPSASFPRSPKKRMSGRTGCVLLFLVLLVVAGIGTYAGAGLLGLHLPGFSSAGSSDVQPAIATMAVNATVTYAGVNIAILSAQQSQSFVDDPNTTTTGMVRLHLQEQNKTSTRVSWIYANVARLVLPGGKTVAPTLVQAGAGIAPGATQESTLDFAAPTSMKISQLSLRLGAMNEAQMDIPLTGHADLRNYAPKTVNPNGQITYLGLNWTLVSATSQLSIAGQQASKGMSYIIVTLKVDNTLSQEAIPGSAYDYIRLKSGSTIALPKSTTWPVLFEAGETGKTGTATFLAPQSSSAYTLILLPQGGTEQATTDFQFA